MPEPHGEEKQDEDLSPEEQEELQGFLEALEKLGSKRRPSPALLKRMINEIRELYPEAPLEERGAVNRLRGKRQQDDMGRDR